MAPGHVFKLEALLEADGSRRHLSLTIYCAVAFELFMFNRPQSTRDIAKFYWHEVLLCAFCLHDSWLLRGPGHKA